MKEQTEQNTEYNIKRRFKDIQDGETIDVYDLNDKKFKDFDVKSHTDGKKLIMNIYIDDENFITVSSNECIQVFKDFIVSVNTLELIRKVDMIPMITQYTIQSIYILTKVKFDDKHNKKLFDCFDDNKFKTISYPCGVQTIILLIPFVVYDLVFLQNSIADVFDISTDDVIVKP